MSLLFQRESSTALGSAFNRTPASDSIRPLDAISLRSWILVDEAQAVLLSRSQSAWTRKRQFMGNTVFSANSSPSGRPAISETGVLAAPKAWAAFPERPLSIVVPFTHGGAKDRSPSYPGVPTVAESGEPGYFVDSWYGVFVPRGTPTAVIDQLNAAIKKVSGEPDFQAALELEGLDASVGTPAALGEYVRREDSRWTKIIKDAGITDNP
ncbi:tripartite tricarboxylate transporter substrate binding protein [Achromobacter sp. UMC71]|uniref:Bug family tripartite tricarboxylate transporter substrate binding protein n=1 Tax=Achromobacter sp. UMC71 TaxID=1862320 RepID=UPI00210386F0|nr:tripartite tricarboxylate transporter substrate-binding protein [Achromobacter sp. UMC71]